MKKLAILTFLHCLLLSSISSPVLATGEQPVQDSSLRHSLSPADLAGYVDPVSGEKKPHRVLRPFITTAHNWQRGHRGVDLDMEIGATVLSAGTGTVSFAGSVAGRPSVSIIHPDGIKTTYTPVHGRVVVGQEVKAGEAIGTLAASTDGFPGLHWGALVDKDTYINPLTLLDTPLIRLKAPAQD